MKLLFFRAAVNLALGVGLVLIALSITASYATINILVRSAQQEAQAQETVILLERLVSQFKATESLQRRYLLTYTPRDLEAYQQSRAQIEQARQRVRTAQPLAVGHQNVAKLEGLIARRVDLIDQAVTVRQQAGLEAATALVGSEQNRQLHDEIDSLVSEIENDESLARERSKEVTGKRAQTVKSLIVVGGLLSLGILAWGVFMMARSRVKRHHIQAQLRDSEALSRAIAESMAEGVVTATQEGIIVNANRAARHLFGYRIEDLVDQPVAMLLPTRYQMGFTAFFSALAGRPRGFRESDTQVLGQRRDGTEFPVNVSFGDVDVGGRRLFTAIIRDVTESRRIAEALRDSEAQLRQLTDNVPALIAYVDRYKRFQFHNKAYEEVFGLPREKIQGKTMLEIMGPAFYAGIEKHADEVLAGYAVRYEREHTTAAGERREYVMSYLPRYGEGDEQDKVIGFFSLGTDVTELKRIDRMKSEFVSTVSHELRTPLTSIRGSLGLVWGGVAGVLPEKAKGLIGIAKNNCERLIRLINDILDSEKIESGKMQFELQTHEMQPLMAQALADNEGFALQHQVRLALHAPKQPLRVRVDSDRLIQVLTNLLSNAIKFSPADSEVQVLLGRHAGRVRVEVRDKGPGIPEAFRQRIFQKFSQADSSDTRQKGGTGLGLNISKAIVERMEGSLGFTTELNAGTTFFFDLPEWREAPPVTAPMSLYGIDRPRVLVWEDDPDVARMVGMMLDKGGFDADMAHTAAQARDYLRVTPYAAMTIDLKPPYASALELLQTVRADKSMARLPVLVLSVNAAEARLHVGQALAISDWLEKPLDEQRLLQSLRQATQAVPGG